MRIGNINGEGRSLFPTDNSLDVPATPAIGFAGDENTGIYQPTASPDNIAFATGGVQRLIITNAGLLTVSGATGVYAALVTSENDIPNKKYVDDAITSGVAFPLDDLTNVTDTTSGADEFLVTSGSEVWITQNAAAQRTSLGMDAGGAGDIWVEKAGDTMDSAANITMSGGGTVLGLTATPTNATEAASKAYVDAVAAGLGWIAPIDDPDFVDIATADPNSGGNAATLGTGVIAYGGAGYPQTWTNDTSFGGTTGATVAEYDYMYLKTDGEWLNVGNIDAQPAGSVRLGVAIEHGTAATALTSIGILDHDIVEYLGGTGGDPTAEASWSHPNGHAGTHTWTGVDVTVGTKTFRITGDETLSLFAGNRFTVSGTTAADGQYTIVSASFSSPNTSIIVAETVPGSNQTVAFTAESEIYDGSTALVNAANSAHNGHSYTYSETTNEWYEISGPGSVGAGDGLSYSGSTLNVNFGAATVLDTGDNIRVEIGTDVGLILSTDGSPAASAPNTTTSKLRVVTDGSTIGFSSGALYVPDAGITATQLNTSVAGDGLAGGGGTALSVGITTNGGIAIVTDELQLDISDLAAVTTVALTDTLAVDQGAAPNKKATFTDVVEDLNIAAGITTNGLVINNGGTFSTVSLAVDGAGPLEGANLVNADGTGGSPTIGIDIQNMTLGTVDLDATDLFIVFDGTNNVAMTGQDMADGLSTLLTIDNTRITDGAAGALETYIDTDAVAKNLTSSVGTGSTHSASAPFTISADAGIDIVSSTATSTDVAGAPITVTGGTGNGTAAGGLIDLEGGVGGVNGAGGAVAMTGGAGGGTSGAGGTATVKGGNGITAGGAVNILGGQSLSNSNGGAVVISGGLGNAAGSGGALNLSAGDGGTTGSSGNVNITAQNGGSTSGNAGEINLITNAAQTSGTDGFVAIKAGAAGHTAVLRFQEDSTNGTDYIGMKAPDSVGTAVTYTLPVAPASTGFVLSSTTGGVMTWVDPVSAGADSYGAITADTNGTTAGSAGATLSLLGATNGGIATVGDSGSPGTITFAMDIIDLTAGTNTLALADQFAVYEGSTTQRFTFTDMTTDLQIPHSIGGAIGFVTKTGATTYDTVTLDEEPAGALDGLLVSAGGTTGAANVTFGLDISGTPAVGANLVADDEFIIYSPTTGAGANETITGQQVADGVAALISLDNTRIVDADLDTWIDVESTADNDTINSAIPATGTKAASAPITASSAGGVIIAAAAGLSNTAGSVIDINAGDGQGTGAGGAITIDGGVAGATADGGAVTVAGGTGGSTSGAGGAVNITGGAPDGGSIGGKVTIQAGAGANAELFGGDAAAGASAHISGGNATVTGNNGGNALIDGGDATGTTGGGGDIRLRPGVAGSTVIDTIGSVGAVVIDGPTGSVLGAPLQFREGGAGTDHISLRAPDSVTTSVDYTLPANVTNGYVLSTDATGVMTWINPTTGGANSYGTVNADSGTINAASNGDTFEIKGATNGGIVTAATEPGTDLITLALDISDLAAGGTIVLADLIAVEQDSGGANVQNSFTDVVEDLQIPNAVGTDVGFVTLSGANTYTTVTIAEEGAGNLQGVNVSAGGTSGAADVTIGLDILNMAAAGANLVAGDQVPVYDLSATVNKYMTGTEIANGVSAMLSLDQTRINDSGDTTFLDTDASAGTITSGVVVGSTNAAGTPLTMSADGGTLLTSSTGTGGNAGGVISLTSGDGNVGGVGGAINLTTGDGGTSGAGGALTLLGGAGGSTSGAGGAVTITAGGAAGATGGAGGDVTITGGSGNVTQGGDATLCGGDGVGVDGGDATLCGGDSDTAAGGSIILQPGSGATDGTISVSAGTSATEMRFYDIAADNYVGFRAADVLSVDTSWIWPTADGSTDGDVLTTDAAGNLSFAAAGSGLTGGEGIDISTSTISLDIGSLSAETITTSDELAFWDVTATANNNKTTVANFFADLDVPNNITAAGIVVRNGVDTYGSVTIVESSAANFEGISVVNGDGSANPTIGLDFTDLVDGGGNMSQTDEIIGNDSTNNVVHTVAELNGGLRLDGLADVTATSGSDTAGNILVADGSDSYDSQDVQYIRNFTSTTSLVVTHNLGQQYCIVQVYVSNVMVIPATVTLDSANQCTITFAVATAGHVVIMGIPGVPVN